MSTVFVQWRERSSGTVSRPMVLWASVMAVVLFLHEAGWGSSSVVAWSGVGATALFGLYLGWRGRVAALFVAPLVSWMFAWAPLWVAAMIRHGFLAGLGAGLLWVSVGWVFIGAAEFAVLAVGSWIGRLLHPHRDPPDGATVVFGRDGSVR